jgi:hypothetical protein
MGKLPKVTDLEPRLVRAGLKDTAGLYGGLVLIKQHQK